MWALESKLRQSEYRWPMVLREPVIGRPPWYVSTEVAGWSPSVFMARIFAPDGTEFSATREDGRREVLLAF